MDQPLSTAQPPLPQATSIIGTNNLLAAPTLKTPTNQWWVPMISNSGESTVALHPYLAKLSPSGLDVTYPSITNTQPSYNTNPHTRDIRFSVVGAGGHQVTAYDPLTVT